MRILSTVIFSTHLLRAEENPGLSNESKRKVAALVEKLKAEDFTERTEAADALKAMGSSIVPVLKDLAPK